MGRGTGHKGPFGSVRSESGQISIMVGMMLVTFIFLAAFVINTGMLVNAKINLQNAADMAAFSGAAVQARQLNQISFLNYEMRRQYKKLLYRYYVVGGAAQSSFTKSITKKASSGQNVRVWTPDEDPNNDFRVPVVCVTFSDQDNYCKNFRLEALPDVPTNPLNAISASLKAQYLAIEAIRKSNCEKITFTHEQLITLWLYNSDPGLLELKQAIQSKLGSDPNLVKMLMTISGLSTGMGLVPSEVLLLQRIKSLEQTLNVARNIGVSSDWIKNREQSESTYVHERTIQAFKAAKETLGNYTFVDSDIDPITLDELLPGEGGNANLIRLNPIPVSFEVYGYRFDTGDNGPSTPCIGQADIIGTVKDLPLGVEKDPSILTYYAVRLKAKAKVLFCPGPFDCPIELKAYSAAQPFGSRIGPTASQMKAEAVRPFIPSFGDPKYRAPALGYTPVGVPNLPVVADSDSSEVGWNNIEVQKAMYDQLSDTPGSPTATIITPDAVERAYIAAMAPNPAERGRYNILSEPGGDGAAPEGGDGLTRFFGNDGAYTFWAPIFFEKKGDPLAELKAILDQNTRGSPDLKDTLATQMAAYVGKLKNREGVGGEGENLAVLDNPFLKRRVPAGAIPESEIIKLPQKVALGLSDGSSINTSFAGVRDPQQHRYGRLGYSVKIVSFDHLLHPGEANNQGVPWTNTNLMIDGESETDLQVLKH